jgi:hypothetical protein
MISIKKIFWLCDPFSTQTKLFSPLNSIQVLALINSRKQLVNPAESPQVPVSAVAESSGDVQTPVMNNEEECDNGAPLYKTTTLNDGHSAAIRTDSVGHDSTGSGNSERLSENHTPASVDV